MVKFNSEIHKTKGTLDWVQSDLWGASKIESLGGARYFLSLVDDFSRRVWVYILKNKNDSFDYFKKWKVLIETETERKIKRLRNDNGLECCAAYFNDFCEENGMGRHHTIVDTPQQNGLAERMNRTIMDSVRCMLFECGLPRTLGQKL